MGENDFNIYKNDSHGICGNTNERIASALESIATNLGYWFNCICETGLNLK